MMENLQGFCSCHGDAGSHYMEVVERQTQKLAALQAQLDAIKKATEPFINYYKLAVLWDEGEPFDTTVEIDICSPDPNDNTQYAILKGDFMRLKKALDRLIGGER